MVVKPYNDERISKNVFVRTFSTQVDESLLEWHRDHADRTVRVVSGAGWRLQFDDELPIELLEENFYYIPKNHYHRIIKGTTDLVLEIAETN
jgi:quercetin dioxygenase-like cupin family protein